MAIAFLKRKAIDEEKTTVSEHMNALRRLGCPDDSLGKLRGQFTPNLYAGEDLFMPIITPELARRDIKWRNALTARNYNQIRQFFTVTGLAEKIGGFKERESYGASFALKKNLLHFRGKRARDAKLFLSLLKTDYAIRALTSPAFAGFVEECLKGLDAKDLAKGSMVLREFLKAADAHLKTGAGVTREEIAGSPSLRHNIRERKTAAIEALTSAEILSEDGVLRLKEMTPEKVYAHFDLVANSSNVWWVIHNASLKTGERK
ncbi:MAG: hypothetical protein PHF51_04430 [Candidatus ainarchaeum sp.]|nr:hypothetical protein [Candidatus ainarchaeum sp.]